MENKTELTQEDIKLVRFFVNKFLKKYNNLDSFSEDFINECIVKLLKKKHLYIADKSKYSNFVYYICWGVFTTYFQNISRQKRKSNKNTLSLDETLPGTEDFTLLDTLENIEDTPLEDYLNYSYILKVCEDILKNKKSKFVTICKGILKNKNDAEIAKELNISREYVRLVHKKFALLVYIKLKQNKFDLSKDITIDISKNIYSKKLKKKYYEVENETNKH